MSAFAANGCDAADVAAADLLALARLDDDGAPWQLTPAMMGVC